MSKHHIAMLLKLTVQINLEGGELFKQCNGLHENIDERIRRDDKNN